MVNAVSGKVVMWICRFFIFSPYAPLSIGAVDCIPDGPTISRWRHLTPHPMGAILGGRVQTYLGPRRQKGPLMQTEYRQHSFTLPAGALDLLLVRHGESEPALHANGAAQAIAVGARLHDEPLMAPLCHNPAPHP